MPPKGWKKNADPSQQPPRDVDPVSIDDILFPRSTLQKLAKSIISDEENSNNMTMAKDSLLALQRSASVFVSYMLFHAKQISKSTGRKTITAQDMLFALERAEFGGFVPEIKDKLAIYESSISAKKQKKLEDRVENNNNNIEGVIPKKSKTEDGNAVNILNEETDEEEEEETAEITEDADADDDNNINEEEEDEEDEGDDDDDEEAFGNPISELGKDEEELEGTQIEEDEEELDDDEDDY
ncbi:DPB4 [Candida jiufengensis]|uniref:DPB4 n=1 Tax=Candida jiufengensis TaxID=497108 RepID=UPI0022248805|nr:DPB4 [Candida jiufengensis]KAI5951757.1 DPB4 [Candida jiufengensis]